MLDLKGGDLIADVLDRVPDVQDCLWAGRTEAAIGCVTDQPLGSAAKECHGWKMSATRSIIAAMAPELGARALVESLVESLVGRQISTVTGRPNTVDSFSGPMRANLVTMLDGIGLNGALGIDSTARLFDAHHHLAAKASAISYPVFVNARTTAAGTHP